MEQLGSITQKSFGLTTITQKIAKPPIHGQEGEGGALYSSPLIRRIGGKINGPIRIWEAAQTEFVVKIRIRIHKSRTNSYFDFFACRRFFWSTVTFGTNSYFGAQYPLLAHV